MKKSILLGLGHGLNDCIAGYILGCISLMKLPVFEAGMAILFYNLVAFGGQMIFAVVARHKPFPKFWLLFTYFLLAASLLLLKTDYRIAVLFTALSSMIIHVIGGQESSADGRARGLGIFAAPGVMGLILGGYWAFAGYNLLPAGIAGSLLLAGSVFFLRFSPPEKITEKEEGAIDTHDWLMILLLMVISLRSAIWDVFQLMYEHKQEMLLPVAVAAMCGKLAGGFLSDRIGHRRYSLAALGLSLPLLSFFRQNSFALIAGIFLLQSSFPPLSKMMIASYRNDRYMGAAMSFGLPIIIGAVLFYTPLKESGTSPAGILLLHLLCILLLLAGWKIRQRKNLLREEMR